MRLPICALLALLAAALTLEPGPAAFAAPGADGVDRLAPTPLAIPLEPSDPLPASGTPDGYFFNLRPYGAPTGAALADHGIYLVARDLSEEMGAIDGGIKRGGFFEGYSSVGADLDLHRIAGIPDGSLHLLLSDLQGQPFASYTGSAYANNRVFASTQALRLNELSYQQDLLRGGVNIRIGRVPAYTQFDGSELYCTFITDLCRTPAAYTFDRGSPSYLASSWVGIVEARLTARIYLHAGVYENEPVLADANHGGFPGPDWGLNYANGATIPGQIGYRTTTANDRYPRAYSVGGFVNTGRYADPFFNTAGRDRTLFGGKARMDLQSSLVYVQAQQMVYRPDRSDRGITLFGGADWAAGGQPNIERMVFGGVYWRGPFRARPVDTVGVAVSYTAVNSRITERIDSVLSKAGGGQASRSEVSYQANYRIAVAPGFEIKPFAEFISHPDQEASAKPSGNNTHAVLVGTLFEVDAAALLGLATLGRMPSGPSGPSGP